MPFGRSVPSKKPLDNIFEEIRQLTITTGDFNGGIFRVQERRTGKVYIEKRFKREHVRDGIAYNEIRILRSLKHKNIVEYVDAYIQGAPTYRASIYMNLCVYGSLDDEITKHQREHRGIAEAFCWAAFKQLANAIGYLQYGVSDIVHGRRHNPEWTRKITHGDLSPRNVFLQRWDGHRFPLVILGDFGCAQTKDMYWEDRNPDYSFNDVYRLGTVIAAMIEIEGPAERYGHDIRSNGFSHELQRAVRLALRRDWRQRPDICDLGPRLIEWETRAESRHYR